MERQIAALFVETGGVYYGDESIVPWDIHADARRYTGEIPVVAHPPCARWCRLAGLVEARWGYKRHEDDGCFASALATVRRVGGVLEHPACSHAWAAFSLTKPPSKGGWVQADEHGGWTCHVEQGNYGHPARKATWLYAVGTARPDLLWGKSSTTTTVEQMSRVKRERTSADFKAVLIGLARGAIPRAAGTPSAARDAMAQPAATPPAPPAEVVEPPEVR